MAETMLRLGRGPTIILDPDALYEARMTKGYSQVWLARKARISKTSVSLYESGHRTPKPETLRRIARALGVQPADLLMREEVAAEET